MTRTSTAVAALRNAQSSNHRLVFTLKSATSHDPFGSRNHRSRVMK